MSTLPIPLESPSQHLAARAQEIDHLIRGAEQAHRLSTMEIGWYGRILKEEKLYLQLGYESEAVYRESARISRSTWYRMIRIAEHFRKIPLAAFLSMTADNAEQLTLLPEDERIKPEWIERAASMGGSELEYEIVKHKAKAENIPIREARTSLKIDLAISQREVIERGLERWCRDHGISDPGYGLELLVAEYTDRVTMVGYIQEVLPKLRDSLAKAITPEELRDTLATVVQELSEVLEIVSPRETD